MHSLDSLIASLAKLPPDAQKHAEDLIAATTSLAWIASVGPQTAAYFSLADILLYGGQGGGGKTDLGLGLAFTAHQRSLILRRQYTDLASLIERALEINGTRDGFNGSPPPKLTTTDGRLIRFGANRMLGDEQSWQGQPFDLKVFDEACQFLEAQIRFHLGWLRSTVEGQRTRALLATNPPLSAEGDFIIKMFRPWLDITHPNPAKPGELRWYVTAPDGSDMEVDGPEPVQFPGEKNSTVPLSRSFIPAALSDNPFLVNTNYGAQLDALPEPLRSAIRDGNFMLSRQDDQYQVIPTEWVRTAMARWTAKAPDGVGMSVIAADVALGGGDSTTYARRHGHWFDEVISEAGKSTPDPLDIASRLLMLMRNGCPIIIDMGGGYGSGVYSHLKNNVQGLTVYGHNGANKAGKRSRDGKLSFSNKRAEVWWKFREALEPGLGEPVALPPDPELLSDLTTPRWKLTSSGIQIEAKEDIRKRLGRSPDKGDAVTMAWSEGESSVSARIRINNNPSGRPIVNLGYPNMKKRRAQ
jgi:hypothetical protein